MAIKKRSIFLPGIKGHSGDRDVLLGFAPANLLAQISFPDILDEHTGKGYQRRFSEKHSIDFRKYIQNSGSATPPLTFNLRPPSKGKWSLRELSNGSAKLTIKSGADKVLAQVDCQHRLGHLSDLSVSLPFMIFLGLTLKEEMEIFGTINGKAKGLSTSLLDFHQAQLAENLALERPELFIALYLNEDLDSPWSKQLDLGGKKTSGMSRRASLRTIQKAVKKFLSQTETLNFLTAPEAAKVVRDFWWAVSVVLSDSWAVPRKSVLTKGIGVYALMGLAGDIYLEARHKGAVPNKEYFIGQLADFALDFDWSTDGPLKGLGGEAGAKSALEQLRDARRRRVLKVV